MSMQLDKNAIDKLLTLDDASLWSVIKMIAAQSGLTLSDDIGASELAALRSALGSATDADIAAATEMLTRMKENNGQ
ncbi:MAG: hypothetical protein IJE84_01225 [Clostridia bacterium]|nr:hypothetical protein [Clostridia bacterium]